MSLTRATPVKSQIVERSATVSRMRSLMVTLGTLGIIIYAVLGALSINIWSIEAASGVPLEKAIVALAGANQPFSPLGGIMFACVGVVLALIWASLTAFSNTKPSPWGTTAAWAAILIAGAPAYFWASFANLNSVGDVFAHWNAKAAFHAALPFYLVSAIGFGLFVTATVLGVALRKRRPHDHGDVSEITLPPLITI